MYNDNISVMCTQDVVEAVQTARFAAGWLQRNASMFHDRFAPTVAGMSDDLAQQWAARALDSEATYEQLRDSTLFNCRRQDDLMPQDSTYLQTYVCRVTVTSRAMRTGRR